MVAVDRQWLDTHGIRRSLRRNYTNADAYADTHANSDPNANVGNRVAK